MNAFVARLLSFARSKFALNLATAAISAVIMALLAMFAVDEISFFTSADRFVQDWEVATRSPVGPQEKPASCEVAGAAVLPVMTLSLIVTVAPGAKPSAGGM